MKSFFTICLQAVLFLITCRVMAQFFPTTPLSAVQLAANRNKALRQGVSKATTEKEAVNVPPKRDCVCSKIYDPVCASNNESYYNLCYLECRVPPSLNVTVVHQGNCIPF
ncbi:uncharacterized protein LOC113499612 [Trichoplusia ni]|uniref:Uncharacterized protein LOC113499612 n=1 Tax=Trichoplusia ni TaxID=7111 RepID=A0A7E5W5H5_TRINI|nr:uncharacterized protein LOC113499612 [Trichoplusia ni]